MYSSQISQGLLTGWIIGAIIALIINALISAAVARAAERKGREYWPFFWLAFLFGWLMLAIIVYAMPEPNQRFVAYPAPVQPTLAPKPAPSSRAFCAECGTQLDAGVRFCNVCGARSGLSEQREHFVAAPSTSPVDNFLAQSSNTERTVELVDGRCPKCNGTGYVRIRRRGIYRDFCPSC